MIRLSTRPARAGFPLLAIVGLVPLLDARLALAAEGHGVPWRPDLGSAQAEARERDVPLWIQFTGPWCVNCLRMERGAFVHPLIVSTARERFVPVKLRSDEYEQLAQSLGLSSLPATVIVRPSGEVIDKWEGFGEPGEYLLFLEGTLSRHRKAAPVAMASHCPVSLVDRRRLVAGRPDLAEEWGGSRYHFADEAARRAFLASPEKYAPANRGECPVRHVEAGDFRPGDPHWGILYRGHLYLCADEEGRARFLRNPERYAHVDGARRGSCPHCWSEPSTAVASAGGARPAASTASRRSVAPPTPAVMEAMLVPGARARR